MSGTDLLVLMALWRLLCVGEREEGVLCGVGRGVVVVVLICD